MGPLEEAGRARPEGDGRREGTGGRGWEDEEGMEGVRGRGGRGERTKGGEHRWKESNGWAGGEGLRGRGRVGEEVGKVMKGGEPRWKDSNGWAGGGRERREAREIVAGEVEERGWEQWRGRELETMRRIEAIAMSNRGGERGWRGPGDTGEEVMADGPVFLEEGYFKGSSDPLTLAPSRQQLGPNSSLATLYHRLQGPLMSGGGGGEDFSSGRRRKSDSIGDLSVSAQVSRRGSRERRQPGGARSPDSPWERGSQTSASEWADSDAELSSRTGTGYGVRYGVRD